MTMIKRAFIALATCIGLVGPAVAQTPANAIEAINVAQQGADIAVKIDLKEALTAPPAGFSVANPARIAFDFAQTTNALGKTSQVVNEGDLRTLNIVQVGERTRLVLNLVRNLNYSTRIDGKSLYVILSPIASVSTVGAQTVTRFTEETGVGRKHAVQDITFRRGKEGEGRIVVDLSDPGAGIDIRQQGSALIVDFVKTSLPEHLRRKLDVTDFATPVTTVETRAAGENVRMTITPKGLWEHNAYQSDNQFVVEVKKIVEDPTKLVQGSKIGYQGPKVSINYQNGDVRALLRLMAEELGLNAVISETVNGTTTLVLKDVPADQVVDIIFQQKGLDMRKNGNVILIAPRDELMTKMRLEAESREVISDSEPIAQEIFQLNYQSALNVKKLIMGESTVLQRENRTGSVTTSNLEGSRASLLSRRGQATHDDMTNKLIVIDTQSAIERVRSLIRVIDIPSRQVVIEARIVEANDTFSKNIGVRLGFFNNNARSNAYLAGSARSPTSISTNGLNAVGQGTTYGDSAGVTPLLGQMVNLPATPRSTTGSLAGALSFMLYNSDASQILGLEISALEADGRGKVISSPRVMTADKAKAIIEQGVEIPYQQASSSGATAVQFKKANLSLEVVPTITPEGKVILDLEIKKDAPSETVKPAAGVAIDTKHVKTQVLVDNGGTVVIGGIYTQTVSNSTRKIPLLGDVPYLGFLFRNKEQIDDKTELLMFITPKVVSDKLSLN